jgi:hypothetical protein
MMNDEEKIVRFLGELGFTLIADPLVEGFLPGVAIEKSMTIRYDVTRLEMLGDLLHEAGHLAMIPSIFRNEVFGNVDEALETVSRSYLDRNPFMTDVKGVPTEDPTIRGLLQCGEQEAQAWSFAAAMMIGLAPMMVFRNEAEFHSVIVGLQLRRHAGINGMAAAGMTTQNMFPQMIRWLQE